MGVERSSSAQLGQVKLISGKPFHIPNSNVTLRQPELSLCMLAVHGFTFSVVPLFSLHTRVTMLIASARHAAHPNGPISSALILAAGTC
jgi:hypothetical protein